MPVSTALDSPSSSVCQRWPTIVVIIATALFVVFFGLSNWYRQVNLVTSQFDMGNMDQVLWHSRQGHWFQMSNPVGAGLQLRTAFHADYLLLIYLPFYAIWPDPRVPLTLQVVAVASGVIPLFWLARKRLGAPAGAGFSLLYLFYPTLEWATIFDVHAVLLVTPLLLWAWWAAVERRFWLYASAAFLAVLGKEEVGLTVAAIGLWWIWRRGYRTMATLSIVLGIGWSMLMVGWAIPEARQAPGHFALGYYAEYGDSYQTILRQVVLHPGQTLVGLFDRDGWELLRALLVPVGLLPILGWSIFLIALPELAINLLSQNANQHTIFFQYMAVSTPFVLLAAMAGWRRLRCWLARLQPRLAGVVRRGIIAGVTAAAAVSVFIWSPLPGTRHHQDAMKVFRPSPYRRDVAEVQRSLRPTDRVVATNNLVPQFSRRDMIWGFPNDLDQAEAIVILQGGDFDLLPKEQIDQAVDRLTADPRFTLVKHHDRFWYFRRSSPPG